MKTTTRFRLSLLILLATTTAVATADVVTLTDGSRLVGNIVRLQDGHLTLETQFAGTIEIDAALVESINTDQPVHVDIDTGDRLIGAIVWQTQIQRALIQTELGDLPVDIKRIAAIWPKNAKSPEQLAWEKQIEEVRVAAEAQRAKWSATVEAGVLYKEGNTESLTARGRAELRRKSPKDLLKFYIAGEYAEESKVRDTAEIKGGAYYEHLITKRLFGYGGFELEYDEFENLDLRVSTAAGLGYYWLKEEHHELKTRGGIGFLHESYMNNTNRHTFQGDLGLDYFVDLAEWLRFTHSTSYYPTFESIRDYRLVSDSALIIPLGDSEAWKLKLGAAYEYKSLPTGGAKRLDQTYYANIMLDIK